MWHPVGIRFEVCSGKGVINFVKIKWNFVLLCKVKTVMYCEY